MRISAYLARAGIASRRRAGELIKAGRVMVDGESAHLNTKVDEKSRVLLDGEPVKLPEFRYILLNKPAGVVTTLRDPEGRRTVGQLVSIPERVVPVGRLDYDTTGALLLTNDGQLAHRMMHPSFETEKVYEVKVKGNITSEILNMLSVGVELEDGMTSPAKVKKINDNTLEISIHEGRNRQVRRMMTAVGLQVLALHRSSYADLNLSGINSGQWRNLTSREVKRLKMVQ